MNTIKVKIIKSPSSLDLPMPKYATEHSSGMDLYANIENPIVIKPMERMLIPTGISVEFSQGYEIQIRPRSGLAWKNGLTVLNTPGTIDADYRGELIIIMINLGKEDFTVNRGDRIAQMVVMPVIKAELELVSELSSTERGEGRFGSTGVILA